MFDFLKKPTHHHDSPQKSKIQERQPVENLQKSFSHHSVSQESLKASLTPSLKIVSQPKTKKKPPARVKQYQHNSQMHLSPMVANQLQKMLSNSQSVISQPYVLQIIKKQMQIMQKRTFTRYTAANQNDYLFNLYAKTPIVNDFVKQSLQDLVNSTVDCIADDIQKDQFNYEVYRKKVMTKEQMMDAQTAHQLNAIKARQGIISSKVGELKMQLNIVEDKKIITKAKQIIQKDTFSKDNEKTKQAQKFVQSKKLERDQLQRKKKQEKERKKLRYQQERLERQIQAEKAKSERHAKLVQMFEVKQMQKEKRKQQIESDKEKFKRFLKEYRKAKPLYIQKMQQQIEKQIQEKRSRFQKMANRKNIYNPISFQDLQEFQSKYLELKRQQEEKKKIQITLKKEQEKFRVQQMHQKHYKGKYRYLVLQQMVNKQAKEKEQDFFKKLLIQKKRAYSVDIKDKYKPKIDENKRMESLQFVAQNSRKSKGPRRVKINSSDPSNFNTISYETFEESQLPDPKKQGEKYRRLLKQYISEKVEKGQVKRPQTLDSIVSVPTPKIDYLKSQRQARGTRNSSFSYQSLDADTKIRRIKEQANGDVGLFRIRAQELDKKAKRQQLKLKYAQHTPNDEKQLQQNYLASIKAKLQLLNNVN